jgi:hypothetical protein
MPMNGDILAAEVLAAMGGQQTPERLEAFRKMCGAIVQHIQKYALVTVVTTCPAGAGSGTGVPGTAVV